jgi:anti-sigma regulatory factor (Ser/Thr protein kinase)
MPERATDPVNHFWSLSLEGHPAMADVRHWVRQRLGGVASEAKLADIVLAVDELVTNAEVHTHSPKSLAISRWRDTVRIEVADGDPRLPVLRPRSTTRSNGRGIHIVDAVSADWGVRRCQEGKCVWSVFGCVPPKR